MEENLNENNIDNNSDFDFDTLELLDVSLDGKNEKELSDSELLEGDSSLGSSDPVYPFRYTDNYDLLVYDSQNEDIIAELEVLNDNLVLVDSGIKLLTGVLLFFLFLYAFRLVSMRVRR